MKFLVLADIHYPKCNINEIFEIIKKENPEEIILLGDIAETREDFYIFIKKLREIFNKKIIIICGDNENKLLIPCRKYYIRKNFLFMHGNNSNIINEKFTKIIAKIISKISKKLLLQLYFLRFVRYRKFNVILGHSHLIGKSFLFKIYSIGTLTKKHYFLDKGFAIVENEKIIIKKLY